MTRGVRGWIALASVAGTGVLAGSAAGQYSLTVLHNNDGESDLLGAAGTQAGSVAEFKTLVDTTRTFYSGLGHGVVTISSGDNFIPSPEFQASLNTGPLGSRTYYDAIAIQEIGYDAVVIGNHDFDAGPAVLADFIPQTGTTQYLGANFDFSAEPALQALATSGQIAGSTIVTVPTAAGNKSVGIIGAATENLPFITSLGGVTVSPVASAVNTEIAAISGSVDHIIIASHLQGIGEDQDLAANLVDPMGKVDLLIAGGGDETLFNAGAVSPTVEYGAGAPVSVIDTGAPSGVVDSYPVLSTVGGIPIVTTPGNYDFLGRITLDFDAAGNFAGVDLSSNLQLNDGFSPDATVQTLAVDPVRAFVDGLAATVIAASSERLDGNGNRDVIRAKEAGLGNLIADAFLTTGRAEAGNFGVDTPAFAIANGGGIRDDVEIGDITLATTFDLAPFGNIVSVVEDVTREDVKLIFENAYSKTVDGDPGPGIDPVRDNVDGTGRFLHVSENVSVEYDITATPLLLSTDNDPNTPEEAGDILVNGNRILSLVIDGQTIVENGVVVPGDTLDLVVVDFLANGGDQIFNANYLSQSYAFTRVGVSDQQALQAYVEGLAAGDPTFDLISDSRYDNVADGRIVAVPEPVSALTLSALTLGLLRRRSA